MPSAAAFGAAQIPASTAALLQQVLRSGKGDKPGKAGYLELERACREHLGRAQDPA